MYLESLLSSSRKSIEIQKFEDVFKERYKDLAIADKSQLSWSEKGCLSRL